MKSIKLIILLFINAGCAVIHHVQVGDIDYKKGYKRVPIELKISEVGVDLAEAADIAGDFTKSEQLKSLSDIISLFQMGPRTGKPVFNEKYADLVAKGLYKRCPSGNITGLISVREMNSYPVVSGEIVKIKGYCLIKAKG